MEHRREKNLISNQSPLIFMHIPKTGGMSMFTAFAEHYGQNIADMYNISDDQSEKATQIFLDKTKALYCGHYAFGIHNWFDRPVYYASVMRHPVSRMISLYNFCLPVLQNAKKVVNEKNVPFRSLKVPNFHYDFSNWVELDATPEGFFDSISAELDNGMVRRFSGYGLNTQKCSKELLSIAKKNIEKKFAAVGLLEKYDETLTLFSKRLGLDSISHNKVNVTKKIQLPKSDFSESLLRKIEAANELDIKLYEWVEKKFYSWCSDEKFQIKCIAPDKDLTKQPIPLWKAVGQSPLRDLAMKNKGVKNMTEKQAQQNKKIIVCKKLNQVGYNDKGVMLAVNVVISKDNKKLPEEAAAFTMSLSNAKILHGALGQILEKQQKTK